MKLEDFKPDPIDLLDRAREIVSGPRRADYGTPIENHSRTAALWSAYLGRRITPEQVCDLNVLQKLSRLAQTPGHQDSVVDVVGYMLNRDECSKGSK